MSEQNFSSSFDAFLNEEGILDETRNIAMGRIAAWGHRAKPSNG